MTTLKHSEVETEEKSESPYMLAQIPSDSNPSQLKLADIALDPDLQTRETVDEAVIEEYKDAYLNKTELPPIIVFQDPETHIYRLVDGNHRVQAARLANIEKLPVHIKIGDKRDAIYFAVGANQQHGLRRNNKDKHRSVEILLNDPEWSQLSDHTIAEHVGVSHPFVGTIRNKLTSSGNGFQSPAIRVKSNGVKMDTTSLSQRAKGKTESTKPATETPPEALEDGDPEETSQPIAISEDTSLPETEDNSCQMTTGSSTRRVASAPKQDDTLRSVIIQMLILGVPPTGIEESILNGMDERRLIRAAREGLMAPSSSIP